MSYLVRFTDPKGQRHYAVNPFDHHALYGSRCQAQNFPTVQRAQNFINRNVWCINAFWNSEREHARQTREALRGWTVEVVPEDLKQS